MNTARHHQPGRVLFIPVKDRPQASPGHHVLTHLQAAGLSLMLILSGLGAIWYLTPLHTLVK